MNKRHDLIDGFIHCQSAMRLGRHDDASSPTHPQAGRQAGTHHPGSVATTGTVRDIVRARRVPGQANGKGAHVGLFADNRRTDLGARGLVIEIVHVGLIRHGGLRNTFKLRS